MADRRIDDLYINAKLDRYVNEESVKAEPKEESVKTEAEKGDDTNEV
jgi:hypothetical protein